MVDESIILVDNFFITLQYGGPSGPDVTKPHITMAQYNYPYKSPKSMVGMSPCGQIIDKTERLVRLLLSGRRFMVFGILDLRGIIIWDFGFEV